MPAPESGVTVCVQAETTCTRIGRDLELITELHTLVEFAFGLRCVKVRLNRAVASFGREITVGAVAFRVDPIRTGISGATLGDARRTGVSDISNKR